MVIRNTDRILVLEKIDPNNKDVGLVDPEVFSGKNNLHAVLNRDGMWTFKYERGIVPEALRNRFTDFNSMKKHAEVYLATKNIRVKEVID